MEVKNNVFAKYGIDRCDSSKGIFILSTNPSDEDLNHPVHIQQSTLNEVDDNFLAFVHRPSLGKINPTDCVGE